MKIFVDIVSSKVNQFFNILVLYNKKYLTLKKKLSNSTNHFIFGQGKQYQQVAKLLNVKKKDGYKKVKHMKIASAHTNLHMKFLQTIFNYR